MRKELIEGQQLTMLCQTLKMTAEMFNNLLEQGWKPVDLEKASDFIQGVQVSAKALQEIMEQHKQIMIASIELERW